jgi:hypothetical protein
VKTNASTDVKLIQKIITNFTDGKAIINILPTDTSSMKFGNYKYDVQLTRVDGTVTTICIGQFTLLEEITYE